MEFKMAVYGQRIFGHMKVIQDLLKKQNKNLEFLPCEDILTIFQNLQEHEKQGIKHILIHPCLVDDLFSHFHQMPDFVRKSQYMDCLIFDGKIWWPHVALFETLRELMVGRGRKMDLRSWGYVTGHSSLARLSVILLADLGFRRIRWVVENPIFVDKMVTELQASFFGCEIEIIPSKSLTLLGNDGSVLINTFACGGDNSINQDLYFLNFMVSDSLIVDLEGDPLPSQLAQEALQVGHRVLRGDEVFFSTVHNFLHQKMNWEFSIEEALKEWRGQ